MWLSSMLDALFHPLVVSIDAASDLIYLGSSAYRFSLGVDMGFCHHSWLGWVSTFEAMMRKFCRLGSKASSTGFRRAFPQILLALASVAWISTALPGWGQANTGSISGTVRDTTEAVVPNAVVTAIVCSSVRRLSDIICLSPNTKPQSGL